MSLAHLIQYVVDGLWAVGGIGAAAELCLGQEAPEPRPCPVLIPKDGPEA